MAADYLQALKDNESVPGGQPDARRGGGDHARRSAASSARPGKLGGEEREFTRLVQVNATEAERGQATTYRPGDVLQFHQNAKGGFTKGERIDRHRSGRGAAWPGRQVLALPAGERSLGGGRRASASPARCKAYRERSQATRTATRMTSPGSPPGGNIRLDDGRVIAADAGHFRHGFVETSFGAQGQTVQRVILGMSAASLAATNQEQMYVSASRAKEWLPLYTDDKEAVKAAIQRSSQKLAALDLQARASGSDVADWHARRPGPPAAAGAG